MIGNVRECPGEPPYAQVSPTTIVGSIADVRNSKESRIQRKGQLSDAQGQSA